MQAVDAEKRIQILRRQHPSTPPPSSQQSNEDISREREGHGHRKRRRLAAENDTDRDIRLAKGDTQEARSRCKDFFQRPSNNVPLFDDAGHIDLFSADLARRLPSEKNPEAEAEAVKRKREYEDQYTMRFCNAGGFKRGLENPWYSSSRQDLAAQPDEMSGKDVWGNEDPGRRERGKSRTDANDPLVAMKKGVHQLREIERERRKFEEEKQRDLEVLKKVDKESRRHHRRGANGHQDSLEDFSLDAAPDHERKKHGRHRHSRARSQEHNSSHPRVRSYHRSQRSSKPHTRDKVGPLATEDTTARWTPAPGKRYSAQFAVV